MELKREWHISTPEIEELLIVPYGIETDFGTFMPV